MKYILRRRPSPALVIACIALFVSLGGVSYGVATGFIDSREIRNNTIRSGDVRNNTLRTQDIRNNEVRGFDIRNSTIQGRDVAFNTLTGADIARVDASARCPSATQRGQRRHGRPAAAGRSRRRRSPRAPRRSRSSRHGPLTLTRGLRPTGAASTRGAGCASSPRRPAPRPAAPTSRPSTAARRRPP